MTKSSEKNHKQNIKPINLLQNQKDGSPETEEFGNINKIRDILFGNQIKNYDNRFSKMELHLSKETSDLKNETLKRLDTLEAYIKEELNALSERLGKETDERCENDKALSHEIKDALAIMHKKIGQVEDRSEKQSKTLREQILEQTKSLSVDINEKYELNSQELSAAVDALSDAKVDRAALSELLVSLGINLSDKSNISEIITTQKK